LLEIAIDFDNLRCVNVAILLLRCPNDNAQSCDSNFFCSMIANSDSVAG
jgi:hypothetical protein